MYYRSKKLSDGSSTNEANNVVGFFFTHSTYVCIYIYIYMYIYIYIYMSSFIYEILVNRMKEQIRPIYLKKNLIRLLHLSGTWRELWG